MKDETREALDKIIKVLDQLEEDINWLKFRIGSSEHWILSKEKPTKEFIGGGMISFPVHVEGEIVPGWWLWTY